MKKHDVNYREKSRQRLNSIITTKLKTAFIGAISKLEDSKFGALFGFGKQESELTEKEKLWREEWNNVRGQILTNGNHQIRNLTDELADYDITWNRNQYNMPVSDNRPKWWE